MLVAAALLFRPTLASSWSDSEFVVASVIPLAVVALTTGALMAPSTADHATAGHAHGDEVAAGDGHTHGAETGGRQRLRCARQRSGSRGHGPQPRRRRGAHRRKSSPHSTQQLAWTQTLQDRYPTLADAKAAGYTEAGPFSPGLGLHLMPPLGNIAVRRRRRVRHAGRGRVPVPDLRRHRGRARRWPASCTWPTACKVSRRGSPGRTTTGTSTPTPVSCSRDGKVESPLGADRSATQEQCDRFGGTLIENTGYMVHLWNVPGLREPRWDVRQPHPRAHVSRRHLPHDLRRRDRLRPHLVSGVSQPATSSRVICRQP